MNDHSFLIVHNYQQIEQSPPFDIWVTVLIYILFNHNSVTICNVVYSRNAEYKRLN